MARRSLPTSPRLAQLQADLTAGDGPALEAFWREVQERGTPLVEPCADHDRFRLLTFLWRATTPVTSVALTGGPAGPVGAFADRLARLPATDVWYRTYRVRDDARFTYYLLPRAPASTGRGPDRGPVTHVGPMTAFRRDPFNTQPFPAERPFVSAVELPGAPPQPWSDVRPGRPAGTVHERSLRSAVLGNERRIWVYSPPLYDPQGPTPGLLVLFDGDEYRTLVPTPTILDNLIADGAIPPLVAVLVGNARTGDIALDDAIRNRELQCSRPFLAFLTDELLPWLHEHYSATTDPARTIVAGSSFGGLAAAFAGLERPDRFGNVLAQSGSFWWSPAEEEQDGELDWLTREVARRERASLCFYLDCGLMEARPGTVGHSQLLGARHFRDVLQAKGYAVRYAEFNGGHDLICWRGTLADGLRVLTRMADAP